MSTRSRIGIELPDGQIKSIYCHFDGYIEHTGKILIEHYSDLDKINTLLDLGDISFLAPNVEGKQDWNSPNVEVVMAYGRDRGEEDTEASNFDNKVKYREDGEEYNYLFKDGNWYVSDNTQPFVVLVDEVKKLEK